MPDQISNILQTVFKTLFSNNQLAKSLQNSNNWTCLGLIRQLSICHISGIRWIKSIENILCFSSKLFCIKHKDLSRTSDVWVRRWSSQIEAENTLGPWSCAAVLGQSMRLGMVQNWIKRISSKNRRCEISCWGREMELMSWTVSKERKMKKLRRSYEEPRVWIRLKQAIFCLK